MDENRERRANGLMQRIGHWPMSHLVMLHGIALSLATGAKIILVSAWAPSEAWLLYLTASLTATFATKRLTYKPGSPQDVPRGE